MIKKYGPFYFIALLYALLFRDNLLLNKISPGDTFSVYTTQFVFLSDALKNNSLAFWNPYVLSGVPTFLNSLGSVLFSPLDLLFLVLSLLVNPLLCVEIQVYLAFVIFNFGFFKLISELFGEDLFKNSIISICCTLVIMSGLTHQINFMFSMCSLPWLMYLVLQFSKSPKINFQSFGASALWLSLIYTKGYFYFNLVNCLIGLSLFLIFADLKKDRLKKLFGISLFFIVLNLNFILITLPYYLDLIEKYSLFKGDLALPEPYIRSLKTRPAFMFSNLTDLLADLFFPQPLKFAWAQKLGPFSCFILAFFAITSRFKLKNFKIFIYSLILLVLGLLLSYDSFLAEFLSDLSQIFASFRWTILNSLYAFFAFYLIVSGFKINWTELKKNKYLILIVFTAYVSIIAIYNKKENPIVNKMHPEFYKTRFISSVENRNTQVDLIKNERFLNQKEQFDIYNIDWLTQKKAISHGFLNTVDPIYWGVKDKPLLRKIIYGTKSKIPQLEIQRSLNENDNVFYQKIISNFQSDFCQKDLNKPNCINEFKDFTLNEFLIEPNKMYFKITASEEFYLNINSQYNPNWQAQINNIQTPIIKSNLIFQSLKIPPGTSLIELKYNPTEAYPLFIYYIICTLYLLYYFAFIRRNDSHGSK